MRRKRRTEVFVETEVEIEVRRRTRRLAPVWCAACGAEVEMAAPDVAGAAVEVSARTVFGWVEAGRVHFTETTEGALLVCLQSLPSAPAPGLGPRDDRPSAAGARQRLVWAHRPGLPPAARPSDAAAPRSGSRLSPPAEELEEEQR